VGKRGKRIMDVSFGSEGSVLGGQGHFYIGFLMVGRREAQEGEEKEPREQYKEGTMKKVGGGRGK